MTLHFIYKLVRFDKSIKIFQVWCQGHSKLTEHCFLKYNPVSDFLSFLRIEEILLQFCFEDPGKEL